MQIAAAPTVSQSFEPSVNIRADILKKMTPDQISKAQELSLSLKEEIEQNRIKYFIKTDKKSTTD